MGFTYTELPKCPQCRAPLAPMAALCQHCKHIVLRVRLQPKQRQLRDLVLSRGPNSPTKIGFGGSRGSSKSRAGRDIALEVALSNPGILVYVVARQLGNLDDNYIKKYRVERPDIMEYFRASPRPELNFPNGSTIAFRYADTKNDMTALERGPEAYLVIVEQAEQFSEEELQQITKPNRWPNAPIGACKTLYLFNPGGPGTEYLQRVFYLKQFRGSERPSDYFFLQSYGWDNWAWFEQECTELTEEQFYQLPGDIPACEDGKYTNEWLATVPNDYRFKIYVTRTSEGRKYWQMSEATRMGDLFGRFDQFAGQYFAGVWNEKLCVLPTWLVDRIVPYWWVCFMGGDLGFGHHTAVYWMCTGKLSPTQAREHLGIDTDWPVDVVIAYREFLAQGKAEADIGRELVKLTPEPERAELRKFVMGSDTKTTDRYALHSRREMIDAITVPTGLPRITSAQDGPGSRVINARLLWEGLRRTCSMRGENPPREQPEDKIVPLFLVSAECPGLISAIPKIIVDPDKPDDFLKLETQADDVIDGCKYTFAEYLAVRDMAPREVRRAEAMEAAGAGYADVSDANTEKYRTMLKFDYDEAQSERRPRKR